MSREDDATKPKKSWREIDQAKDQKRSGGGGRSAPEKGQRSAAYRNYKTQLNKLFDGGGLQQLVADKLGTEPGAPGASTRQAAATAIVEAKNTQAMRQALAAYEAQYGFPEAEDVLAKLLDTGDEALVLGALHMVEKLHAQQTLKRGTAFKARIKTAQLTLDDPDIREVAGRLLAKL